MARLNAEITDKNLNKVMAHEAEKNFTHICLLPYRTSTGFSPWLPELSCARFQLFLWFRNIRKAGIKIFPFHFIFFCALKCELNNFRVC